MKFGGTSLGGAGRIKNAANIVKHYAKKNPVVVVSAVSGITDKLIELANAAAKGKGNEILEGIKKIHYEILENLGINKSLIEKDIAELSQILDEIKNNKFVDAKALDNVQSFGERMSSKIVAAQLNNIGVKAQAFNSWELGFFTDSEFGKAEPLETAYKNLGKGIKKLGAVPVVTGFIGRTEKGDVTTLGRGGSDYTAAIIGSAINADEIQIWTDVDGIMTADPRIVANAKTIEEISFAEASELAYFGAKALHPKTILPAMREGIPVKVLNSFNPENKGTVILNKANKSEQIVKAIACKKGITLVNIDSTRMLGAYGFLARIFNIFDKYKKSVDVVATSEVSVSLTVEDEYKMDHIIEELSGIAQVNVLKNKSIVCVVGEGMKSTPGVAGRTFTALGRNNVNIEMISLGASKINITFSVDGKDAEKAVKVLHGEYFETKNKITIC
ncbi:lysine-sensitive aspartokinase 3 [Candidatus Woesearchaeota archaeon]|nr:lysine-sensitive aspartokinase 3 [Candidatus Woesearchaeota archaeon]